jgi:hypothetical protein
MSAVKVCQLITIKNSQAYSFSGKYQNKTIVQHGMSFKCNDCYSYDPFFDP